jgi:site-specific DNA recombinase
MSIKRAVIYTRVSTDEQTRGYSLQDQRDKCIAKAKELGCDEWIVFEEDGVSGEIATRPALMDAINVAQSDPYVTYFICKDPDRLSRNTTNLLVITEQITKHAELVFIDFQREETPEGKLFYAIRGSIAEFEKELIRRRTMAGKLRAAREGKWSHWPGIYGYDYADGQVTVNENEARIVRLIFQYGAEMGVTSICERLAMMGIPSPRARKPSWSRTTVRRILNNEAYYTGVVTLHKYNTEKTHLNKYITSPDDKYKRTIRPREEWIRLSVPPIITEEEYRAAQRRLANARRRFDGTPKHKYLLSGLIRCGLCGHTWHGFQPRSCGRKYYVCTLRSPGPRPGTDDVRCKAGFVGCDVIDDSVWDVVRGWLESDELIKAFNAQQQSRADIRHQTELDVLRAREVELSREEDLLIERITKETSSRLRAKLDDRLNAVSRELDHIQAQIRELTEGQDQTAATVDEGAIKSVRERIPSVAEASWEDKYWAIHALIREIVVTVNSDSRLQIDIIPLS